MFLVKEHAILGNKARFVVSTVLLCGLLSCAGQPAVTPVTSGMAQDLGDAVLWTADHARAHDLAPLPGGDVVNTSTTSPTRSAAVVARLGRKKHVLEHSVALMTRPPGGPDGHSEGVDIARMAGGHDGSRLLVLGSFVGRLKVGRLGATSGLETIPCHPGPVGHERSLPPGCTRQRQTQSLFLLRLPLPGQEPHETRR